MEKVLHILLHTLEHTAILLPFLFVSYILIELLEYYSAKKLTHSKLLSNRFSTLFGASFGLVPQCGFSVVATDLFAQKKIKIGTLLAVYIATSDEAIPLLLATPNKSLSLIPLILIKFVVAIIIVYIVDLILKKYNQKRIDSRLIELKQTENKTIENAHEENHGDDHHHEEHAHEEAEPVHTGCCGHHISEENSKSSIFKQFFLHPLIHTLKIFAFIFIVTFVFNGLIEWLGEESISSFLKKSKGFAPLFAAIIGLIPNCASSVIITNLFAIGGIGFGALMSGLIVNAGIAFFVLFKQNKNIKENFLILLTGIFVGYSIQLLGF